jgi:DNA-binding MarR family transcriptional regulator
MNSTIEQIERELTRLIRRALRFRVDDVRGHYLERPSYSILAKIYDDGPQRFGVLAWSFGLDPSTITRQVQALEQDALVRRTADPADRRAYLLELTDEGRTTLELVRGERRRVLRSLLETWPEADLAAFATLLERFNIGMTERTGVKGPTLATARSADADANTGKARA